MEEAYDSGVPLSDIFGKRDKSFLSFLKVFEKCVEAVAVLHTLGYYHLDLKPQNISYTASGNVKLFDTDSFVKAEELGEDCCFCYTPGYSAPELEAAASYDSAYYLIGPWTDSYSLTQILCWYLYGHPLMAEELDEAVEALEEKIRESFCDLPPDLSRKGLWRLKRWIFRNLSRHPRVRTCSMKEMLDEIREISVYLFYWEKGELIDNFQESTGIPEGNREVLRQLETYLVGENRTGVSETYLVHEERTARTAAVLVGMDREERESVARYFASCHRADFSDIVEVHARDLTGIRSNIALFGKRIFSWMDVKKPSGYAPFLLLLFDEQEKDVLTSAEARELEQLWEVEEIRILIVGCQNRYSNRPDIFVPWNDSFEESVQAGELSVMDLDRKRTEEERETLQKKAKRESGYGKQPLIRTVLQSMAGILLMAAGESLVRLASEMVGPSVWFDTGWENKVYSLGVLLNGWLWVHVLGAVMITLGIGTIIHAIFDWVTPYEWQFFLYRFHWEIMAGAAAVFARTMPPYFLVAAKIRFGGKLPEMAYVPGGEIVNCLSLLFLFFWLYGILSEQKTDSRWMKGITMLLLGCSLVSIVLQTLGCFSEQVLFLVYWCGIWLGKRLLYGENVKHKQIGIN